MGHCWWLSASTTYYSKVPNSPFLTLTWTAEYPFVTFLMDLMAAEAMVGDAPERVGRLCV